MHTNGAEIQEIVPPLTNATSAAKFDEPMPKKDFQAVQLQSAQSVGGLRLGLNSFAELEKFSHFMAISNFVPKHLRNKQADCLAVLLQSMRWEMDPFAVSQKTYFVNEGMGYEAQLVNAIILSRAPIKARPKLKWSGDGDALKCEVSATFNGENEPSVFEAEMKTITTKNSPLWKQQPKQQLAYFALRAWARLYCPDVIMGVYTKEEVETIPQGPDYARDITPIVEAAKPEIITEKAREPEATPTPAATNPPAPTPAPAEAPKKTMFKKAAETVNPDTGEVTNAAPADSAPKNYAFKD